MICPKCGAEAEGKFCTVCGERIVDVNSIECNDIIDDTSINKSQEQEKMSTDASERKNKILDVDRESKICLILGIVGLVLSCITIGIPIAIVAVIKGVKILKKEKNTKALVGTICGGFVIFYITVAIVWATVDTSRDSARRKELDEYVNNQQYEEAFRMMEDYDFGKKYEFETYCTIYETTGDYDSMVDLIISYYNSDDKEKLVDNSAEAIEKLDVIYGKVSDDNKIVIDAYKSKVDTVRADLAVGAQKAEAEAKKAEAEAATKQAEADKAASEAATKQAETAKAKAEADKAASEAATKQAETAKAKAEADKAASEAATKQAETDKAKAKADKAASEAASKQAEADKAASEAATKQAEADKAASEAATKQAETDKTKEEDKAASKNSSNSGIPTKEEISRKSEWITYDDVMRYRDKYIGCYVSMAAYLGSVVLNSDNKQYNAIIGEYQMSDESYNGEFYSEGDFADKYFIIRNCKKDNKLSWIKGDTIFIYGKYVGVETYYQTNEYTDKRIEVEIPIIEVYYDELIEN